MDRQSAGDYKPPAIFVERDGREFRKWVRRGVSAAAALPAR
jgi:hypothetical protein